MDATDGTAQGAAFYHLLFSSSVSDVV